MRNRRSTSAPRDLLAALLLLAGLAGLSSAAAASDYSNICRTADGLYEIDDGTLYRAGDVDQPGREIPYVTESETVIRRETGYCLSNKAKGQRFSYESKTSVLHISFTVDGRRIETTAICELAADGLPAAYNCDRQVVVSKQGDGGGSPTPPPVNAGGKSLWMHNGSIMRLEAIGTTRRIYYEVPRKGIRGAGAARDTLLFMGERDGEAYDGTAYIFARGCAPEPYRVRGSVTADDRTIVMTGRAPRLDGACRITGYREDRLVFTYVER